MKKEIIITRTAAMVLLVCCFTAFLNFRKLQGMAMKASVVAASKTASTATAAEDWVPYVTDNNNAGSQVSGFNFKPIEVKSAAERKKAAAASKSDKVLAIIKAKIPDYPFKELPVLKPAMVINSSQRPLEEDVLMDVLFCTEATMNDTLAYYRNIMKQFEGFKEEKTKDSSGDFYTLSAVMQGKYKTNVYVSVMEMPKSSGYSCGLEISLKMFGAAKVENQEIKNREDGLPGNYPEKFLPIFDLKEILEAQGDSKGCSLKYYSNGTYEEALDFFRNTLNDKVDFLEDSDTEEGIYFSCLVPGWQIEVRVMDEDGLAYIETECLRK